MMITKLSSIAQFVLELETFPIFDIAHNFLAALDVRNSLGNNFAKNNPLVSWALTILCIFSGSLISNLLLGQSVLAPLSDTSLLSVATGVWFFVSFAPFDIIYRLGAFLPVKLFANILKEIYRAKKISNGVLQASRIHPHSWIIMIIIGTIRGNGAGVAQQVFNVVMNVRTLTSTKPLQTSFSTKSCIISALIFVIKYKTSHISLPYDMVYLGIVIFLVVGKVYGILLDAIKTGNIKDADGSQNKKEN